MRQTRRRLDNIVEVAPPEAVALPVYHVWRGHELRTPYFAAIGIDSNSRASAPPSSVGPPPVEPLNAIGMLEALRFYKIPGWTRDPEK